MTEEVRWLNLEQQKAWRNYLVGSAVLTEYLNDDLAQADLTLAEYEVMVRLSESDNHQLRMSVLADSLVHSRSRLTHTVARMERRGLVRRTPATCDRRGVDCMLTEKGFAVLQETAPQHVKAVRKILVDAISPEELHMIGQVFGKIAAAAEKKVDFPQPSQVTAS